MHGFIDIRSIVFLFLLALLNACASPTHKVDPYPGEQQPQHNTNAYQSSNGSIYPAVQGDALVSAGLATIDAVIERNRNAAPSPLSDKIISIDCEIVNSQSQTPCSSVFLILKTETGGFVSQGRTNEKGQISFPVKREQNYRLEVKSTRFSMTLLPAGPLQAGAKVRVKLQPLGE